MHDPDAIEEEGTDEGDGASLASGRARRSSGGARGASVAGAAGGRRRGGQSRSHKKKARGSSGGGYSDDDDDDEAEEEGIGKDGDDEEYDEEEDAGGWVCALICACPSDVCFNLALQAERSPVYVYRHLFVSMRLCAGLAVQGLVFLHCPACAPCASMCLQCRGRCACVGLHVCHVPPCDCSAGTCVPALAMHRDRCARLLRTESHAMDSGTNTLVHVCTRGSPGCPDL